MRQIYPVTPIEKGKVHATLKPGRVADKPVDIRRRLPGNIILVHGVNDVGTSYQAVEQGLCEGLRERLHRTFKPGEFRMPEAADKEKLLDDPDAVFYKRTIDDTTDSPVIPFYWGFREADGNTRVNHGQQTDRNGNRLDKDLSKGGGPYANATSSLPDMWNKGFGSVGDISGDALRPLLDAPGRLYMVLAAQRLAALVSMIRDYDAGETVTIIGHSQGCLVTLLAQAMLAEKGLPPADTLILTHPPYSLEEQSASMATWGVRHLAGGTDAVMKPFYDAINGVQSMQGRLQTLINIVHKVVGQQPSPKRPVFSTLADHGINDGAVGGNWKPEADRDNRNKVYLYFCPLDMTVALDSMQGIGWQGVPEYVHGTQWTYQPEITGHSRTGAAIVTGHMLWKSALVDREALGTIGAGFYQRVFSNTLRSDRAGGKREPVLVGRAPPYDYILRLKGEDDLGHVVASGRTLRTHFPIATWPANPHDSAVTQRNGIRKITGEALPKQVEAVLSSQQEVAAKNLAKNSHQFTADPAKGGPCEAVSQIDAEIAVTSTYGMSSWQEKLADPRLLPGEPGLDETTRHEHASTHYLGKMTEKYNSEKGRKGDDQRVVIDALYIGNDFFGIVEESPNESRLRWQHEFSGKSFHGSIIGNAENHRQVTAYDVAIGGGKAASDPEFYAYLCAVADWRLKILKKDNTIRPGILKLTKFKLLYEKYLSKEPKWRIDLIEGNANYYSSGNLPILPLLTGPLWEIIISETMGGNRVPPTERKR